MFVAAPGLAADRAPAANPATAEQQAWIAAMKEQERGPFSRIRWFCNDGSVLAPEPFACAEHGGGVQHGEWSDRTREIRARGYSIANVLAAIEPADVVSTADDLLQQILLEQFLVSFDEGWILQHARFYRGAFQAEDEEAAGRAILKGLLLDDEWLEQRFLLIYEAARLLPHGAASAELTKLRADAAALHEKDPGFSSLRNKIHGRPDPGDAESVREYAMRRGLPELEYDYEALAAMIDVVTSPERIRARLDTLGQGVTDSSLARLLEDARQKLNAAEDPALRVRAASRASEQLRHLLPKLSSAEDRLAAIDAAVALDQGIFASSQALRARMDSTTRQAQIAWLEDLARAFYGIGGLSPYEWRQFQATAALFKTERLDLDRYRAELRALTRAPSWAQRRIALHFETSIRKFSELDPLALEYIPDRLRSSSMLMYSAVLESLSADANRLAGVRHEFFGETVSTGLRSLNPGLATGILMTTADYARDSRPGVPKILVVPETLADLPPVAGILTEHEGNHLSHVQLLARNLGIPNVVVGRSLLARLDANRGKPVTLASSPGGIVNLSTATQADLDIRAERKPDATQRIVVNTEKLDLDNDDLVSVSELRSADSGVRVGPKAAQLGELTSRYPGTVSSALAIPFGAFRDLLDSEFDAETGMSAFEWLKSQYAELAQIADATLRTERRNRMLANIREWILNVELDPGFVQNLRQRMHEEFGPEGTYGAFVRSDTNVEDLPGFTGAGLNLTVPNVVGFENTVQAIRRVWASPFTERSFGWRQALMDKPEHLYAAVLIHEGVNSDKSGVMVTANIETGTDDEITVVANEGVGGGVEGQSAETIVIHAGSRDVRLHSSATAPLKRVLLPEGGTELVPVSGADRLLSTANVNTLVNLATDVDTWLKNSVDGSAQIADVEFGFVEENLVLFQIRPFVESSDAASNEQLLRLDEPLRPRAFGDIDLTQATTRNSSQFPGSP